MKKKILQILRKILSIHLLCLFLSSLISYPVLAQNTVSGKVTDENGEALPGVNIVEKGTTNGTVSGVEGNYTLELPSNSTLVFSSVGYTTEEIQVANRSVIDVAMMPDIKSLAEVVVVGYGVQQKKDITGAVSVIDAEQMQKTPAPSFAQQLQGRAAGVTIGSSGAPNAGTMIRIRGIGSVNNNSPLIVIDGVSTKSQDFNSINPNDIESIQVLKDASAASIYGAQASNGVIIITTKKGTKSGLTKITYDGYAGVQNSTGWYDMQNTEQFADWVYTSQQNNINLKGLNTIPTHKHFGSGSNWMIPDYLIPNGAMEGDPGTTLDDYTPTNRITRTNPNGTNWGDEIFRTGQIQNHQVSALGGGENGSYAFGMNYYKNEGTIINTNFNRYTLRANTEFNAGKFIDIGENLMFTYTDDRAMGNQAEGNFLSMAYRMVPYIPVYDIAGNFAGTAVGESGNAQNPVAVSERAKDNLDRNLRLFGNIFAEAHIADFNFKTSFGLDYRNEFRYGMTKLNPEHSEKRSNNEFFEAASYNYRWVFTNTLDYTTTINNMHRITALVGTEAIRDGIGKSLEGQRRDYFFEDDVNTWTLGNGSSTGLRNNSWYNGQFSLFGVFGRVDYSLNDKYLLTGILRYDGVSRFQGDNQWGYFPSVSAGWRISEEDFLQTVTWLSDMKIRAGYGTTGNAEIPSPYNWAYQFGTSPANTNYDLAGTNTSIMTGYQLEDFGNPDTKWETSEMANLGFDISMFDYKLNMNLDLYRRKTSDMLVRASYTYLAGNGNAPFVNLGDMLNTGLDLALDYNNKIGELTYNVGMTFSTYKNEVLKINNNDDTRWFNAGSRFGNLTITEKGQPVSMFWGWEIDGFFDDAEEVENGASHPNMDKDNPEAYVGKYKFVDNNGRDENNNLTGQPDGVINGDDQTIIGNPHPDFTGGLNLNLGWKNWDMYMYFYGSYGNDIYNYVKYWTDFQSFFGGKSTRMLTDSWRPDRRNASLPILDAGDNISDRYSHTYYVEDGSFLRMRDLQIGYNIPLNTGLGIENLRVYVQGSNLFTITKYTGLDPDLNNLNSDNGADLSKGLDFGNYPTPRIFMAGVNLSF
ncbi:MAG: SusC/RagA family TonB-linked outer membrane protein [Candidatus Cyclobacteriaceae bacterium M3_2C_046]